MGQPVSAYKEEEMYGFSQIYISTISKISLKCKSGRDKHNWAHKNVPWAGKGGRTGGKKDEPTHK